MSKSLAWKDDGISIPPFLAISRPRVAWKTVPATRISTKKIGGLRFVKIGRLTLSFSISKG